MQFRKISAAAGIPDILCIEDTLRCLEEVRKAGSEFDCETASTSTAQPKKDEKLIDRLRSEILSLKHKNRDLDKLWTESDSDHSQDVLSRLRDSLREGEIKRNEVELNVNFLSEMHNDLNEAENVSE
jgi:ATP-dependent protease HslVU (ClpYQ) ATPase subunit